MGHGHTSLGKPTLHYPRLDDSVLADIGTSVRDSVKSYTSDQYIHYTGRVEFLDVIESYCSSQVSLRIILDTNLED